MIGYSKHLTENPQLSALTQRPSEELKRLSVCRDGFAPVKQEVARCFRHGTVAVDRCLHLVVWDPESRSQVADHGVAAQSGGHVQQLHRGQGTLKEPKSDVQFEFQQLARKLS